MKAIIQKGLFLSLLFISCIFIDCQQPNSSIPTIEITSPSVRSPLYYNLDTMFLIGLIYDQEILTQVSIWMENKDRDTVFANHFSPMAREFQLNDSIAFSVNDHTNYILYIKAINEQLNESDYSIFIHVMP
jgi:hypothetical protein